MTDDTTPDQPPVRLPWTAPVLEQVGTIHDVKNGQNANHDGNNLPPAHS